MGISKSALSATLIAPVVLFGIVGCAQQSAEEPALKNSESSVLPIEMTEQEALEAAQNVYTEYLNASNLLLQDAAINPEMLKEFLSDDQYAQELLTLSAVRERSQYLAGSVKFDGLHIQEIRSKSFSAYLCLDASGAKIVDQSGNSPLLEAQRWPLLVTFSKKSENNFLISGSETWTGTNFC